MSKTPLKDEAKQNLLFTRQVCGAGGLAKGSRLGETHEQIPNNSHFLAHVGEDVQSCPGELLESLGQEKGGGAVTARTKSGGKAMCDASKVKRRNIEDDSPALVLQCHVSPWSLRDSEGLLHRVIYHSFLRLTCGFLIVGSVLSCLATDSLCKIWEGEK